jgi:hypothetical protein
MVLAASIGMVIYRWLYVAKRIDFDDARALALFLGIFCLYSPRATRQGAALRLMAGLFAGVLILPAIPLMFGIPLGLCVLLVIVGGWISLWSDMRLGQAMIWFAKRSIRRETIFLLMFLAGIGAIGIRQAQNYVQTQAGLSGLASSIAPGSFQALTLSSALAMRVRPSQLPSVDMSQAYFRSAVMERMDGFKWFQGPSRLRRTMPAAVGVIDYKADLSPRFSEYAPVLDYGLSLSYLNARQGVTRPSYGRDTGVFFPTSMPSFWQSYAGRSSPNPTHLLAPEDRQRLLQVDESVSGRVVAIAEELSKGGRGVPEFMLRLGRLFADGGFRYTLSHQGMAENLEDFLAGSKAGYCEHYAAASASLARIAGIPARVVAGFQGGQWEPQSLTLYIRDMDAHAWAEFWDDQSQRWQRFDGVQFVAPSRITLGAERYLRSIGAEIPDAATLRQKIWLSRFFMALDEFVTSFQNTNVINAAGSLVDYGEEMAILGVLGLTISYVLLRSRRYIAARAHPHRPHVRRLEVLLDAQGLGRLSGEPVRLWLERAALQLAPVASELRTFAYIHDQFCYSAKPNKQDVSVMKALVRKLQQNLQLR